MPVKFLDLRKQYDSIKSDVDKAIADVVQSSAFISGHYATVFEEAFAGYQQVAHCIGCGNGTDAIEIAVEALGLPPNSEIIVPANTFIATSEAVTRSGHKVVFCDCDFDTYTISVASAREKITPKTRAVLAVHLYGQPCNMDELRSLTASHDLKIIEDCAQAHGAEYKGVRVGGLGDVGTFSFYPGKNLGAYGDAGAIVTNDGELAKRARMIANHGRIAKYDHEFEGRNSRLDGMQAAILSVKLRHLNTWTERRIAIAELYSSGLRDVGDLALPARCNWSRHVFHLFVVRTKHRDALMAFLQDRGIETGVHYPISLPRLKAYARGGQADEPLIAHEMAETVLSLPIGDHMSPADAAEVVEACRAFYATRRN